MNQRFPVLLIAIIAVAVAVAADARADVPARVTFTARLVNGTTAFDGPVQVQLRLFPGPSGGSSVWSETHDTTAASGLVSLAMGERTPLDASVVNGTPLHLQVTVNGTDLSPRLAIGSVPYALVAARADSSTRLGTLAETDVQRRIGGTCTAGSSIREIDAAGAVTCEADSGLTSVSGSGGITSTTTGTAVSLATDATVQRRTSTTNNMACPSGQYMRTVAQTGQATCVPALTCQRVLGVAGAVTTQTVTCPAGHIVMGGGCSSSSNTSILDSFPQSTSSWFCRTTTNAPIHTMAICCDVTF
jgi:hypothetical protein